MFSPNPEPKSRLLARLVRETLHEESFDTVADLTDALKFRCARLHIRWTPDDITEALRVVESNTPLVRPPVEPRRHEERSPDPVVIDRPFATAFLAELGYRVRTMAPATWRDPDQLRQDYEAARARAYEMGVELSLEDFLR
jgi:hypothetical protein